MLSVLPGPGQKDSSFHFGLLLGLGKLINSPVLQNPHLVNGDGFFYLAHRMFLWRFEALIC